MKTLISFLFISTIFISCRQADEELMRFTVRTDTGISVSKPVNVDVEAFYAPGFEQEVALIQLKDGKEVPIPFQVDTTNGKRLWFVQQPNARPSEGIEYVLRKAAVVNVTDGNQMSYVKEGGDLTIYRGEDPVLSYRYEMNYPPDGVDSLFQKSGYIHPLWSPSGDTLTRINPPDHYHHYGIWGPWTRTKINDRPVDFWNLGEGQGTVTFDSFANLTSGSVYASFTARQNHLDFGAEPSNRVALKEDLEVKVWNLQDGKNQFVIDYTSSFGTPLASGILFEAYRYGGGIGIRATEKWHTDNSAVLTSEGKDRFTADGTNARWCIISGISSAPSKKSGILFMSHPENKAHPEPMRVWPSDFYEGRSNMFFEFSPIRDREWMIEPRKTYKLNYRMLVFDGEMSTKEAEAQWQSFAWTPIVQPISTTK